MLVKMMVTAQSHDTWPAAKDREAGEFFNLHCIDLSQPPQARMRDNVVFRLSKEEVPLYWDKSIDNILEFELHKTAVTKAGKTVFIGKIAGKEKAK